MTAAAALVLVLAPLVREPVGVDGVAVASDPFQRRLAGLMVGEPVTSGFLTVVPLTARVPSEAGLGQDDLPGWHGDRIRAVEVAGQERIYVRLVNAGERALLVPAGTVLAAGERELFVERDAIVPPEFSVLCPAREIVAGDPADGPMRAAGGLAPLPSGLLLHENPSLVGSVLGAWQADLRVGSYVATNSHAEVDRLVRRLRPQLEAAEEPFASTIVGLVVLVGGEVAGAHVFASGELYRGARDELLSGAALQALQAEHAAGNPGSPGWRELQQRTRLADTRGRALAWLRAMIAARGCWAESWGEGFDLVLRHDAERTVGNAVVDHRRRLIHASFSHLGEYLVPRRSAASRRGPLPPPVAGGSEAPPGQVDRKARPTLAESRSRERRPGPPGTGGASPR